MCANTEYNPNVKVGKGSYGTETWAVNLTESAEGGRLTEDKKTRGMEVLCLFKV
jgi:hypothetical protein